MKFNITNSFVESKRINTIEELHKTIKNGSLRNESYYQLLVANFFEKSFEEPLFPMYAGTMCLSNYHCFGHGQCANEEGKPYCLCDQGYSGAFCQLTLKELFMSRELANATFDAIDHYFVKHVYPDRFLSGDLEYLVFLMRGILKNPEISTPAQILKGLKWMKKCMDSHIEVVYAFTNKFHK